MKIILKITLVFLTVVGISSWIFYEGDQGHFVYLNGKKQYVLVEGSGQPTIVFLTGKGCAQTDFKKVYQQIKNTNQIFSYDRAGLGQSEAIRNDRRVDTMAFELHELLIKENIKPPYVLVGHSLGGYIMRCFVNQYPQLVSGMVFVEPSHEYEFSNGIAIRTDSDQVVFKNDFKSFLKMEGRFKADKQESKFSFDFDSLGFSTNQRIVKGLKIPDQIPITVLIAKKVDVDNDYIDKEMEYKIQYFEHWKEINPKVKVMTTLKSGYFIQKENPELVIHEIYELLNKIGQ